MKDMVANGRSVASGLITEKSKFIFRSRSAKFFLYLQMSKEMWEFAEDGELYFEKAVSLLSLFLSLAFYLLILLVITILFP